MVYDRQAPRPHMRGPRPNAWKSGPDPEEHKRYRVFIQQRNQAQWREEGWTISFEAWKDLWNQSGQWANRGRERCLLYTSPSPRDGLLSRMPSSA